MVRDFVIEVEPAEPTVSQVKVHFFANRRAERMP